MNVYKRIFAYTRPYLGQLLISLACSLIVGGATAISAKIVQNVVDDIFMNKDEQMLLYIPFVVLGLIAAQGAASFGQVYYIEAVGQQVVLRFRRELFAHLQRFSL